MLTIGVWAARVCFVLIIALLAFFSFIGPESEVDVRSLIPWDKARHVAAYFSLTVVGMLAFPNLSLIRLGGGALLGSTIIEITQPAVGRTFDFDDLLANGVGIAAVAACVLLSNLRETVRANTRKL
jgi:VanZ family protein